MNIWAKSVCLVDGFMRGVVQSLAKHPFQRVPASSLPSSTWVANFYFTPRCVRANLLSQHVGGDGARRNPGTNLVMIQRRSAHGGAKRHQIKIECRARRATLFSHSGLLSARLNALFSISLHTLEVMLVAHYANNVCTRTWYVYVWVRVWMYYNVYGLRTTYERSGCTSMNINITTRSS